VRNVCVCAISRRLLYCTLALNGTRRERKKGSAEEFQVHARETNLVGEPNAEAEQHAPDDEHGDVHGRAGHDAAGEEEGAAHEHDDTSPATYRDDVKAVSAWLS
jgi:hypothetical protein